MSDKVVYSVAESWSASAWVNRDGDWKMTAEG